MDELVQVNEDYEVTIKQVVGVFCDPETYPSVSEVEGLAQNNVIIAIGWHPKKSGRRDSDRTAFKALLDHPTSVHLERLG